MTRSNYAKCRTKQYWAVFLRVLECCFFCFFVFFDFREFFLFSQGFFDFLQGALPKESWNIVFFLVFSRFFVFFWFSQFSQVFFGFLQGALPKESWNIVFFWFSPIFLLTFSPRPSPDSIFEKLII